MASIVYNPSNAQPESVSVKTGVYTIPAGYYAYVTASVQGADTFSIGGVVALAGVASVAGSGTGGLASEVDTAVSNTTAIFTYTVPTGYYFYYNFFVASQTSGLAGYDVDTYINSQTASGINVAFRQSNAATVYYSGVTGNPIVAWSISGVIVDDQQGPYGPGTVIGVDVNSTATVTKRIAGTIIRPNSLSGGQSAVAISGSFWVPENTVLTTSGGSYTVTLYPNLS